MKRLIVAGSLLVCCGCSTMNNTEAGALGGGIFGGALGTAIGCMTGHPLAGAAIGAGTGALAGGAIGNSEDRADRRQAQAVAHHINNPPVSLQDVVSMSQKRYSDQVIMQQINTTGSVYQLTPADLDYLKQNGVSDQVVLFMQQRRPDLVRGVGQPGGVMVVDPPVAVGVGVGYGWGWGPHYRRGW